MVTVEVFVGAWLSLILLGAGAFYWVMSEFRALRTETRATREELRQEIRATREELHQEIREESQERRSDTQRILEAIYFHRHDAEGAAIFYPPTQAPQAD